MKINVSCMQIKEHKNQKLTEKNRKHIWQLYQDHRRISNIADKYNVSRPTIYKVIKRSRVQEFQIRNSTNTRYRWLQFWLKRLAKIQENIVKKQNNQARRYNKQYPWEMFHVDTKMLPYILWDKEKVREYLFIWIDDYSRELYVYIWCDKTQDTAAQALAQWIDECPYVIECVYSDNGKEYKWTHDHTFMKLCQDQCIKKKYTKIKSPQTNGKAERVIRTLMDMRHTQNEFISREHRRKSLIRFVNRYNCVKAHKWINNKTPYEMISEFYSWKTSSI